MWQSESAAAVRGRKHTSNSMSTASGPPSLGPTTHTPLHIHPEPRPLPPHPPLSTATALSAPSLVQPSPLPQRLPRTPALTTPPPLPLTCAGRARRPALPSRPGVPAAPAPPGPPARQQGPGWTPTQGQTEGGDGTCGCGVEGGRGSGGHGEREECSSVSVVCGGGSEMYRGGERTCIEMRSCGCVLPT